MDIETFTDLNNKVIPYCICFRTKTACYSIWYSEKIIINFLEKVCEVIDDNKIEIYTHNINYDGYILIDFLKETNIFFEWFSRDLNIYWIKIHYFKNEITIRCSYKIIALSVEKIGKLIDKEKGSFPYKFASLENLNYIGKCPNITFFNSEKDYLFFKDKIFDFKKISIEYCINDINIVYDVLKELLLIINNECPGVIKKSFSFSSISYKIFIKKFDKFSIKEKKIKISEYNYIKNGYYGGRCEVFGNPTEDEIIHHFDFSGMYGQCMLEKFPINNGRIIENNLNLGNIGFHTIKFKCQDYLPYLPFKSKKLLFPNGIITGTYWYEEIQQAINYGKCEILEHYSSFIYDKEDYVFKEYVEKYFKIRQKGKFFNFFGKNMINGLYGTFALKIENSFDIIISSEEEFNSLLKLTDVIKWKKIGKIYIMKIEKNSKSNIFLNKKKKWDYIHSERNIAYSAIIASKARIKLNSALEKTLKDGGKLYYTDTDSIFAGFKNNRIGIKSGDITWTDVYEDGVFIASKFYQLKNNKIKIKGGVFNSNFDDLKNDFYSNKNLLELPNQLNINKKNYELYMNNITKKILLNFYEKRNFSEDKKKTNPIYINTDYYTK